MKNFLLFIGLWTLVQTAGAQSIFRGRILDQDGEIMLGAVVRWADSTFTQVTSSDEEGWFEIERPDTINGYVLKLTALGFEDNFVEILPHENHLSLVLAGATQLSEVKVEVKERGSFNSVLNPINVEQLNHGELRRAACCSLAESFENNASVNVGYADAVSGAREIEMLGLRGTYTQMTVENRPAFNRLGRTYGMEYLPGTWMESIQISKGASTVRNGLQSVTGGINAELIKPVNAEPLFVNVFANHLGRAELNLHLNKVLGKGWSTGLLLHGNYFQNEVDHNHDGFLDLPLKKQANALWRTFYGSERLHFEFNVQGIADARLGGQTQAAAHHVGANLYQFKADVRRVEAFGKLGYFGFENPRQSLAMLYSASYHEHRGLIGLRNFDAFQRSLYWNGIYQSNLFGTKEHAFTGGITLQYDDFIESFTDFSDNRLERLAGAYAEYEWTETWEQGRSFTLLAGLRSDYVQVPGLQGLVWTPRLSLKYNLNSRSVLRASAGRALRNPNALMENLSQMATYRRFVRMEVLRPELAWNYGLNYTQTFFLGGQEGSFSIDAYRTDFENQLIADLYTDPTQLRFYNLRGRSFANSLLLAVTQELVHGLELRLAYKYNDLRSSYEGGMEWQPYSPRHRGLVALHYETPNNRWQFNANAQFTGPQRLPLPAGDLSTLPSYRQEGLAPAFVLFNAQATHRFPKQGLELYVGAENLGNYRQQQPIIDAENPFATSGRFDAASVYAPVMGTMVYAGFRWSLGEKPKNAGHHGGGEEHHHGHDEDIDESKYSRIAIQTSAQCGMCKETIEHKFLHFDGVVKGELDLKNKQAILFYDAKEVSPEALRKAISELGYDADEVKANPKAYEQLPSCCKKAADR